MAIPLKIDTLFSGIVTGNRVVLGKAITLIESKSQGHRKIAEDLLEKILPLTGKSVRIGITGVPGVGKSTFIENFGEFLTQKGKKLAVLSIDPSSSIHKGSILGDKTRMENLSRNPNAFIRPSASGQFLGGVAQKTRETMLLCEAAGYDTIIVETVGVGQSETAVREMVDCFILLMLAGGGDELQGIKRGIMEMADLVIVNKVDGDNMNTGALAVKEYQRAIHLFPPHEGDWTVPTFGASGLTSQGLEQTWKYIEQYLSLTTQNGYFDTLRKRQNLAWFQSAVSIYLEQQFYENPEIKTHLEKTIRKIKSGSISVRKAIDNLMKYQKR